VRGEDWRASAPCASIDPELWFPEPNDSAAIAKRICANCPYKAPCLLGAFERNERHGIWAGMTIPQIRKLGRSLEVAA
jgi:hypothetical protein